MWTWFCLFHLSFSTQLMIIRDRWNRNVRRIIFQRKRKDLQDVLLIAVPQFRDALLLFSRWALVNRESFRCNTEWAIGVRNFHSDGVVYRIIEELRTTLLLPQEQYRSYTLLEFKEALITMNHGRRQILETLAQCRGVILNQVLCLSSNAICQKQQQLHRRTTGGYSQMRE